MLRLTVRGVEACLDEVRPYLMADGGDVEVVDVQDGIVYLRLQVGVGLGGVGKGRGGEERGGKDIEH